MKESRKLYREKIWKVLQLEKCKKSLKWVNQSIYRSRSSGYLALFKRSFRGFFTKKSGKNAISHDCVKFSHGHAKLVFSFPFELQSNFLLVHFARLCEFSPCSCEMEKHRFQLLFVISPISFFWIHLNHLQLSSKAWSKCIASSSSSTLCTLLNSISFLSLNA